jgi:hypothetical protein
LPAQFNQKALKEKRPLISADTDTDVRDILLQSGLHRIHSRRASLSAAACDWDVHDYGATVCRKIARAQEISSSYRPLAGKLKKLSVKQELVFIRVDWVSLNFDVETNCTFKYPLQTDAWMERRQGEEEIRKAMASGQPAILPLAIKAVDVAFFSGNE